MPSKVEWYGDEFAARMDEAVDGAVKSTAFKLQSFVQTRLSRVGKFKSFDKQADDDDREFVARNGFVDAPGGSPRLRTGRLRRAITSVPTNIAEGSRRQGQQEYSRFLNVAQSSAAETEYLLILCRDLGHLSPAAFDRLTADLDEVARMLHGLRSKVEGA